MIYKNVLITGGAGFIGSNIANKLILEGYNVTVLDNLSKQIHGDDFNKSFLYLSLNSKIKFIKGDVTSESDWINALDGIEVVIHLAAETGTGQSMYNISRYTNVNINGTSILLDYIVNKTHNIKKVIVASSRAIYGEGKYYSEKYGIVYPGHRTLLNLQNSKFDVTYLDDCNLANLATDEDSKLHPSSIYGITKLNQEQMIMTLCESVNLPCVAFRYQNVFGPGQSLSNPYTGIISIFSNLLLQGKDLNIFEDGLESRDFVYIDDVVDATILGLKRDEANYQVFNVGSGIKTNIIQIADSLIANL
jgi:dTDP-L-rhamnose 4-epimerase